MKNGEFLYKQLKLGEINKSQLTEQQKGDLYKYMVDSKKVTADMIKPEVAQKYNLSTTPTYIPSRSKDTNVPVYNQTIPSRSPDTNAPINMPTYTPTFGNNFKPTNKSTNPEMELVDLLSNLTLDKGRTHERQQGSAYTPKPIEQPNISRNLNAVNANEREKPQVTWSQNPIQAAAENVRAGWNQFGRTLPSTLDMVLGDKGIPFVDDFVADQRRQQAEEAERISKINQGGVSNFAGSVAQGIGQSIPSVATSLIAAPYAVGSMLAKGGTQLINYASKLANPTFLMTAQQAIKQLMSNPNTYMSVLRGVGSQYEQAINDGTTKEKAIQSAITGGVPSGLIEALGGAENLTNVLASKAPFGRAMVESGLGELFEEILQYPVENIAQKYSYDKDMPWFSTTEQAVINPKEQAYAGASAFVSSALMGGAGSGLNALFNKLDSKQQQIIVNVEEGLNEIYTELDEGTPATEQDLNKTIEVLQNLEQQYPDLKEYLQGHMNKIDSYKEKIVETFKQPQTNEINEVEQSIEQDTNVAQIGDNDVTEDINEIVDDNKIDNIISIEELRQKDIEQPTAEDYLKDIEQDMQIQEEYPVGTKIQARNGNTFEVISKDGDLFTVKNTQTNQEQSYTEGGLKRLGNILQESNDIVTETKQEELQTVSNVDNVTNVTETQQTNDTKPNGLVSLANKFNEAMQSNATQEQLESEFQVDYVEQLEDEIINYIENNDITEQEKNDFVTELRKQLGDTDAANELWELGLQDYWTVDNAEAIKQPTTNEISKVEQIVEEEEKVVEKTYTDNEELNAKIQRAIENEAFEKSMKVFGYKSLEEKHQHDNDKPKAIRITKDILRPDMYMNQRLQFEALTKKFEKDLQKDKKFAQNIIDEYDKKKANLAEEKQIEETYKKKDWQVTREDYINRGSRYRNGRFAGDIHKDIIQQAIKDGENIPNDVLKDYPDLAKQVERKEDVKPKNKGGKHKKPKYSGEVFYKGKLIGKMTVADSDAFTTLLEAANGDAQKVLNEYAYFSTELRTALEKVAEIQRQEKSLELVSTANHDSKGNTLSKEQQEILKDSKLRDKNGNILLVYHGTDRKFDKFEPNQAQGWGTGIYFTDNIENAKEYGENIIEAYLDIKKPFYDTDRKVDISNTEAYKKYADKIVKERAAEESMTIEEYIEEDGYPDWELEWDRLYDADGDIDIISDALQELGYDAFVGEDSNNIKGKEIVVFNSDQIIRRNIPTKQTDVVENETTEQDYTIKDSKGSPLILYHGTNMEFDIFDKTKQGKNSKGFVNKGFYFTTDEKIAKHYAAESSGDKIIKANLIIKNPLTIQAEWEPETYFDYNAKELFEQAQRNNNDGIIIKGGGDVSKDKTNFENYYAGKDMYVVFEPEQIKIIKESNTNVVETDVTKNETTKTVKAEDTVYFTKMESSDGEILRQEYDTKEKADAAAENIKKLGYDVTVEEGIKQTEFTIDNFMDSVNENDIDFKRAENAYRAVSFDPDKRAKSIQSNYVDTMKEVYNELLPLAETDEQKVILLEEMQKFKENYLKKQNAVLDATSRTMSSMITGPAKFPTARNQKALETEHKRMTEFSEWLNKAVPTIKKKLDNSLPDKGNEMLNKLKKEIDDTIASLIAVKNGSPYNPAAFRNSLKGYFERNLNNGYLEEVIQAAEYLKEQQKEKGITVFMSANNIWKQIESAKAKETDKVAFKEYDGAEIVENKDIDRIQIFFDETPSEEIRNEMKKTGWHYSKANNNAWQRKITNNAKQDAEKIIGKYFKAKEETEINKVTKPQLYRYYLTQRPPAPGAIPRGSKNTVSFDTKQEVDGLEAWGYVEYDKPLTEQQISDYELTENSETETVKNDTKVLGKTGIAKDNEGNAIEFVYEVVNVNDLITSHDTNLNVNNNYPSELQPRERTRTASQMQVNDIVNNLQPEFLGENPKISDGSPIVGNDNIVESGNGRTIALAKMYQSEHKNSQKYIDWLNGNAETFGIDKSKLPDNPVLIRRRTTEVNRAEFVKKANESSIATMSATETARSDADKLTNEVLSLFVANENGIINTTDNKGFIGKFISEVIPKNEQNKYLTDKGELSQEGLARVRNAIFYKAYGDINLMNKLAESLDNNTKNITNTMLAIAPKIVDVKTNIIKGNLYDIDYSSDIAQAANEYIALKETGKDVELYLQQESLFDNEDTALVKDIIAIFNANNRSAKKMAMVFNKLFDSIESLGNPNQMNMFGEMETPDKVHVLEATLRRLESEDNAQVTLFQSERKESTGDTQSNKGQTRAYKGGESYTRVNNSDLIDMSRKLKKPTEIRKDITKKFGVPNSTKKFNRSKKFLGYYKVMPEVIRLRYDNDIGTVMHELGHHFDKKYGFNNLNKQLITDMINKMNPAFKDNYQKSELPGEAIAEFLRYYTTDPATAEQFAGEFYNLFESTLDKTDLKNIQDIRSDVLRWVNAERAEKRQSTIVPLSQKKKVSERISETIKFEKNNALLFDRYAPIQEFVKTVEKLTGRKLPASLNPYMLVERTYKNNSTIEGLIKGQLRDTEFKPLDTDDSLQKIVDDVKKDVTQFEDYLKLKHAITLAEKDHMIYNPDIYNNVEDMQQDLEFIEQQYPQFVELSERLYDWYDKFFKAWVVDTNMLGEDSKKVYEKMRQEYPYYVPMFRVREDGSSKQASSSLTDQKSPVDRLSEKGNDRDTISPIDNIVTQVSRMVNAYSKNNVMRAIVENYNTVDGLGGFIDRVPPDMEKQILSTQKIKDSLEAEFEDVDNIDDIINSIPDLIENYKPLTKSKDKEIVGVITKSGKRQFYQVFDKAFLNSLTNMNPTQLDTTVRMIASIRRTTTALTTGLNPIFGIVSNAPRDFMQAYVFGSYKNPAEYVYEYVKALTGVIRGNENYKTFRDIGGVYGSSMTSELRNNNDFIRRLTKYRKGQKVGAKNALSYVGELILDLNDAIETAPRLAEFNKAYKIAKNRGDSDYDATLYALSRADDVTLNFSRRGEIMNTAVGQSIPYLNAGLQGMDKLRRGLFTGEERTQTLIKSITMLTIPTILLWLAHRDDEDYEKLTKGIKDNYWILWKNPDGSFVRIPKPKDLSTIFSADFERALNAYFKEEGAGAFEGFYSTIADSLLPPVDTVFRPLIDVIGNEKWSGGKIIPMAMDYLPKTEQYDETTSKIAVRLAQLVGKVVPDSNFASPKNVDYILDQYYGGLADILLPITTPTTYVDVDTLRDKYNYLAMPMAAIMQVGETINRKFKADPSYSNDVVNDFYDLRDKTIKANNAYEKRGVMSNDVDLIAETNFKAYYKSISSMWKTIDTIDSLANKTLPDEYKEGFKKLINQSRFTDSEKKKVLNDLKDGKLNRESVTMLQKTVRGEIVKLADKAVKEYKANHKKNNEVLK